MTFSFGVVWSRFFKLLGENAVPLALLTLLLVLLPQVIWQFAVYMGFGLTSFNWALHVGALGAGGWVVVFGGLIIVFVLGLVNMCAITEVAIVRAVGKPVQLGEVFGHAFANVLPVFVISVLTALLACLCSLLFLVPGIIFGLAACVAVPSYVGEKGRGLWGSVQRSFELTKGHRWTLFLVFLVAFFALMFLSSIVEFPIVRAVAANPQSPSLMVFAMSLIVNAIWTLLSCVFFAAIYVTLRESKDKLSPDQTASIF